MIGFSDKKIQIDGKDIFLLSGELHYYRQSTENWQHLIDEAKSMGLNCIASYVPWILHEEKEGEYNFNGRLNLGSFIDLCAENGLYFVVRPGPFIMAEMKKEGIPYWVSEKHKSAVPVGFDGEAVLGNTLDYLNDGYLGECRKWYGQVMKIIVPRLNKNGGNIIGVQLDNEIGMLNWVTNKPVLNDNVLLRFTQYCQENNLNDRYPFELNEQCYSQLRSPAEEIAIKFHMDFGKFLRRYYADYVAILREYAIDCGVTETPFLINIHGTGDSRIFDFPLGVSQLYTSYNQFDDIISGTDVYLGEPCEGTYQDMYVSNVITDAMNKNQSPLTSIEFGCSDGGYISFAEANINPTAPAHQMLLCLSQNMRMINFYVFSGGENYELTYPKADGCGRMAFTGQRHCLNAPIRPDMTRNYAFEHIKTAAKAIHAVNGLIGRSKQVIDGVTMGFIPDYFLTETAYPKSPSVALMHERLKNFRCAKRIDSVARGFLSNHIAFDAKDIQNDDITPAKLLFVLTARYMPEPLQKKLLNYITNGAQVLLYGELPEYDMDGNPCAILMNGLGLYSPKYIKNDEPSYYLSYNCSGRYAGVTASVRGTLAQVFQESDDAILSVAQDGGACGFKKSVGKGMVYAITCDYPSDMAFYRKMLSELNITPTVDAKYYRLGIYLALTQSEDNQNLLYVINLDSARKTVDITLKGEMLYKDFFLEQKASFILPINVQTSHGTILHSTAEFCGETKDSLSFRLTQFQDIINIKTTKTISPTDQYDVKKEGTITTIISKKNSLADNQLTVKL